MSSSDWNDGDWTNKDSLLSVHFSTSTLSWRSPSHRVMPRYRFSRWESVLSEIWKEIYFMTSLEIYSSDLWDHFNLNKWAYIQPAVPKGVGLILKLDDVTLCHVTQVSVELPADPAHLLNGGANALQLTFDLLDLNHSNTHTQRRESASSVTVWVLQQTEALWSTLKYNLCRLSLPTYDLRSLMVASAACNFPLSSARRPWNLFISSARTRQWSNLWVIHTRSRR